MIDSVSIRRVRLISYGRRGVEVWWSGIDRRSGIPMLIDGRSRYRRPVGRVIGGCIDGLVGYLYELCGIDRGLVAYLNVTGYSVGDDSFMLVGQVGMDYGGSYVISSPLVGVHMSYDKYDEVMSRLSELNSHIIAYMRDRSKVIDLKQLVIDYGSVMSGVGSGVIDADGMSDDELRGKAIELLSKSGAIVLDADSG